MINFFSLFVGTLVSENEAFALSDISNISAVEQSIVSEVNPVMRVKN